MNSDLVSLQTNEQRALRGTQSQTQAFLSGIQTVQGEHYQIKCFTFIHSQVKKYAIAAHLPDLLCLIVQSYSLIKFT